MFAMNKRLVYDNSYIELNLQGKDVAGQSSYERKRKMNIDELVEVHDCPVCGGAGILEEECGSSYYVMCTECGAHSVNIDFKSEEDRLEAAERTALLWNTGKVIKSEPGE